MQDINPGGHGWNRQAFRGRMEDILEDHEPVNNFAQLIRTIKDGLGDDRDNFKTWRQEQRRVGSFNYTYKVANGKLFLADGRSFQHVFIDRVRELGPERGVVVDEAELARLERLEKSIVNGSEVVYSAAGDKGSYRYLQKWQRQADGSVLMTSFDIAAVAGRDFTQKQISTVMTKALGKEDNKFDNHDSLIFAEKSDTLANNFFTRAADYVKTHSERGKVTYVSPSAQIEEVRTKLRTTNLAPSKISPVKSEKSVSRAPIADNWFLFRLLKSKVETSVGGFLEKTTARIKTFRREKVLQFIPEIKLKPLFLSKKENIVQRKLHRVKESLKRTFKQVGETAISLFDLRSRKYQTHKPEFKILSRKTIKDEKVSKLKTIIEPLKNRVFRIKNKLVESVRLIKKLVMPQERTVSKTKKQDLLVVFKLKLKDKARRFKEVVAKSIILKKLRGIALISSLFRSPKKEIFPQKAMEIRKVSPGMFSHRENKLRWVIKINKSKLNFEYKIRGFQKRVKSQVTDLLYFFKKNRSSSELIVYVLALFKFRIIDVYKKMKFDKNLSTEYVKSNFWQNNWLVYLLWVTFKYFRFERPQGIAFGQPLQFKTPLSSKKNNSAQVLYHRLYSLKSGSAVVK